MNLNSLKVGDKVTVFRADNKRYYLYMVSGITDFFIKSHPYMGSPSLVISFYKSNGKSSGEIYEIVNTFSNSEPNLCNWKVYQ